MGFQKKGETLYGDMGQCHALSRKAICKVDTQRTRLGGENQDGGVGGHTAPPRTTRTDRKSNGKEVRHQGDKKMNIHPDR